ncbi:MAG: cell division protein ZapE [Pseudomonadota bacterium]
MPNESSSNSDSVSRRLSALVDQGLLKNDPVQADIATRLDGVLADLEQAETDRVLASKNSALGWLFAKGKRHRGPVQGLYIWGSVGRGKTMLMDMFFDAVPFMAKRRSHFHAFMRDAHAAIHAHREAFRAGETKQEDPVPSVANAIVDAHRTENGSSLRLLCFDEFAISDIADAMILSRLFTVLFSRGVTVIATSNVPPGDLYKDGINRASFLPFVDLLQEHVSTLRLDAPTDYRRQRLDTGAVWFSPLGANTTAALDEVWERWTGEDASSHEAEPVMVHGRTLKLQARADRCARASFSQLCEQPLGAHDYLALTERFDSFVIDDIPAIDPGRRNEAKRLIILVDTLYDAGARLAASAAAEPWDLYRDAPGTEGFEFERTQSRLTEMRSSEWLDAWHKRFGADQ